MSKRDTFSWFSVIEFLLGDLMNPNKEFASSTVAEITGSSKGFFRINVALALPTSIAYIVWCICRHHLASILFLMSHKIEQQQLNDKSASILTIILHLHGQINAAYTDCHSMANLN